MWFPTLLSIFFLIYQINGKLKPGQGIVGNPLLHALPCTDNEDIIIAFEPGLPPGEENQYNVFIGESFPKHSRVILKFDSEAAVTLSDPTVARVTTTGVYFNIRFFKESKSLKFHVRGLLNGTIPYMTSIEINNVEACQNYTSGYFDSYVYGYQDSAAIHLSVPDESCGRRKVQHVELITNGLMTKSGDWPWHAALYKVNNADIKYICGGTLLSKIFVLTAAHCTTIRGVPVVAEILSVVLGKYNLIGGDVASQEREVHEVIVHEQFSRRLDNDISLVKLKSEAVYGDYVQPACLWYEDAYKKLPQGDILGTVVGWGFDHTDKLSSQLRQATMPRISEAKCIKSNPVFFGSILNDHKFCAGLLNGTSACNGDSGGGFHVFIPDTDRPNSGSWYVRGIVSLSVARKDVALCDPSQYVIFIDVAKYIGWIQRHIK